MTLCRWRNTQQSKRLRGEPTGADQETDQEPRIEVVTQRPRRRDRRRQRHRPGVRTGTGSTWRSRHVRRHLVGPRAQETVAMRVKPSAAPDTPSQCDVSTARTSKICALLAELEFGPRPTAAHQQRRRRNRRKARRQHRFRGLELGARHQPLGRRPRLRDVHARASGRGCRAGSSTSRPPPASPLRR